MGLPLRCRRYIFLGSGLHLELLHSLLGLRNVDPIVVAAHLDSLLTFFFGKDTDFAGKSAFSFRNHSFSRIRNQIQVKVRKALQILTDLLLWAADLRQIEFPIPLCKAAQPRAQGRGGPEAEVPLQWAGVGVGYRHVAGLHGNQFLVGLKVVIGRQNPGGNQLLLQNVHEIQQIFRILVADVVHRVGRDGQTILAVFLFRRGRRR